MGYSASSTSGSGRSCLGPILVVVLSQTLEAAVLAELEGLESLFIVGLSTSAIVVALRL